MAVAIATATFTGAEDSIALTWTGITSNPPKAVASAPVVTDAPTAVPEVYFSAAPTNAGGTLATTARFAGTVTVIVMD
jgi:hypothetical protein